MNAAVFAIQTIGRVSWEIICHSLGRTRLQCVKNISGQLARRNVVCAKLFQALSVGIRVLTEEEAAYLSQYTDSVPFTSAEQRDVAEIAANVTEKTGKELVIGKTPCNAGVIALAYNGTYDGRPVIVKVKRNGIVDKVRDGLAKMETLVHLCMYVPWLRYLDLETVFGENRNEMLNQCDFRLEIANASKFKASHRRIPYVKVPDVYQDITDIDPDVIVLEKLSGLKATELEQQHKRAYGNALAKLVMKSALYDGFYHADLHAGNLLFSGSPEEPVLGIFDFGIMGHLSDSAMEGFYEFFKPACLDKDYASASAALTRWLVSDPDLYDSLKSEHKAALQAGLVEITADIFGAQKPLDASLITRANTLLRTRGLSLSREFCKLQLALAVGAGVAAELCGNTAGYTDAVIEAVRALVGQDVTALI